MQKSICDQIQAIDQFIVNLKQSTKTILQIGPSFQALLLVPIIKGCKIIKNQQQSHLQAQNSQITYFQKERINLKIDFAYSHKYNIQLISFAFPTFEQQKQTDLILAIYFIESLMQNIKNLSINVSICFDIILDQTQYIKFIKQISIVFGKFENKNLQSAISLTLMELQFEQDAQEILKLLQNIPQEIQMSKQLIFYRQAIEQQKYITIMNDPDQQFAQIIQRITEKSQFTYLESSQIINLIQKSANQLDTSILKQFTNTLIKSIFTVIKTILHDILPSICCKDHQKLIEVCKNQFGAEISKNSLLQFLQSFSREQIINLLFDIEKCVSQQINHNGYPQNIDRIHNISSLIKQKIQALKSQNKFRQVLLGQINRTKTKLNFLRSNQLIDKTLFIEYYDNLTIHINFNILINSEVEEIQIDSIRNIIINILPQISQLIDVSQIKYKKQWYQIVQLGLKLNKQNIKDNKQNNIRRFYKMKISEQMNDINFQAYKQFTKHQLQIDEKPYNLLNYISNQTPQQLQQANHTSTLQQIFKYFLQNNDLQSCMLILLAIDHLYCIKILLKAYLLFNYNQGLILITNYKLKFVMEVLLDYFDQKLQNPIQVQQALECIYRCFNFIEMISVSDQKQLIQYQVILHKYLHKASRLAKDNLNIVRENYKKNQIYHKDEFSIALVDKYKSDQFFCKLLTRKSSHESNYQPSFKICVKYLKMINHQRSKQMLKKRQQIKKSRGLKTTLVSLNARYPDIKT